MEDDFRALLMEYSREAGVTLTEAQAEMCSRHVGLMLDWNRRLNLTRIVSHEDIIVKHLLDSVLPAKFLPPSGRALDVGSGAGFPGIPLKIVNPALDLLLLDSNRKKVSFLAAVTARLGLKGLQARHGRWENLSESDQNGCGFQLITMRAVRLEPVHLSVLASRLLDSGGMFAFWAGPDSDVSEEVESRITDLDFRGKHPYSLPGISRERSVLIWRKR